MFRYRSGTIAFSPARKSDRHGGYRTVRIWQRQPSTARGDAGLASGRGAGRFQSRSYRRGNRPRDR